MRDLAGIMHHPARSWWLAWTTYLGTRGQSDDDAGLAGAGAEPDRGGVDLLKFGFLKVTAGQVAVACDPGIGHHLAIETRADIYAPGPVLRGDGDLQRRQMRVRHAGKASLGEAGV